MTDADLIARVRALDKAATTSWYVEQDRTKYGHRIYDRHCNGVCKPTSGVDGKDSIHADLIAEYRQLAPQLAERLAETLAKVEQMRMLMNAKVSSSIFSPSEQRVLSVHVVNEFAALFPAPARADTERTT